MITVQTNVASLNAQNNLMRSGKTLNQALERLSSGLRINRAADDAAGLAISEGLRSQVRGLNQAVRNANDGISLVNTAEAAIVETTNILQRMRELAVQASSDTNSSINRTSIQNELDQLAGEVTRIGNTVEFNGLSLLDGQFQNKNIHIGAFAGADQKLEMSISDMRSTALGKIFSATSDSWIDSTAGYGDGDIKISTSGGSVDVDKIANYDDGVSSINGDNSAIAVAAYVNAVSSQTGVYAEAQETVYDLATAIGGGTLTAATFKINGVQVLSADMTVAADDSDGKLRAAINAVSDITGVTAELDAGDQLNLKAADGRNIHVQVAAAEAGNMGASGADTQQGGKVKLYGDESWSATVDTGGSGDDSTGFTSNPNVTTADADSELVKVKVTTAALAGDAIRVIDNAMRQVSTQRSELGALTNRIESTISNLRTVSENMAASDSRIRDADFAAETANLTKAQILQQAGTAILAQANLGPQAALSLLQ